MPNPPMRHLAAVMFTDLVGYTGLMQADEDAARAARTRHRQALQEIVPRHQGRLDQFFGDGSLSLFSSSVSAVEAALEVQRALQAEPALPLRIGIDAGEVAYDDQGVYGHCVNRASRIQGVAHPGSVYISEQVYQEVQNQSAFSASYAGAHQLKNVAGPVRVYSIRETTQESSAVASAPEPQAPLPTAQLAAAAEAPGQRLLWRVGGAGVAILAAAGVWAALTSGEDRGAGRSESVARVVTPARVAILPFPAEQSSVELSGLWSLLSDYLADAGNVTSVPYVNVGARIDWRNGQSLTPDSAATLARALGATHFTLGEMRQVDDASLSLSISLYESGEPDSAIYRHLDEDSTGYQHRLVRDAAFALLGELSPSPAQLNSPGTESIEAYKEFKAGETEFLATDFQSAIAHFEAAVEIDPGFVMAHYRLSQSLEWDEQYLRALSVAKEAGSLASVLGEHDRNLVLAWGDFLGGRADDAETRYFRILDRWDDDVEALYGLAKVLMFYNPIRGRSREEARPWLDRLLAVSPAFGDVMLHLMEFAASDGEHARFDSLQSRVAGEGRMIQAWRYSEALSRGQALETVLPSVDDPVGQVGYPAAQLAMHWRQLDRAEALVDWYSEQPEAMPRRDWLGVAYLLSGVFNMAQGQWSEGDDDTRRARAYARGWALELQAMQACLPGRADQLDAATIAHQDLTDWTFDSSLDESLNELLLVHNGKHATLRTYLLGLTDVCRGETPEAATHLGEIGSGDLETTLELSLRAHIAYEEGDPDAALVYLDRIVQHPSVHELAASPFMSRPHDRYLRARIFEERGDHEAAARWYQGLTEVWDFTYLAAAHLGLARTHAAMSRPDAASEHYQRAAELWRAGEDDALAFLAETRMAAGMFDNTGELPAEGLEGTDQR